MNAIAELIAKAFALRRRERSVHVVDEAPLFGGGVVHVVDVDGRRLVFATSHAAICLLAKFENRDFRADPEGSIVR